MAERLDARLSVRPASDRNFAEMNQPEKANVDPLFELARMVSGRGASGAPGTARRSALSPLQPAGPGPDVVGDLEAELLNDLQASFQAVRDLAPTRPSPPPLRPVAPAQAEPTGQQPRAVEGVVRERLTDALAALAPVIKLDRSLEVGTPGPAPSGSQNPRGSGLGSPINAANTNAPFGPEGAQPAMGPATSGRLRDALGAFTQPQGSPPIPTAEAAFSRAFEDRAASRATPSPAAPRGGPDLPNVTPSGAEAMDDAPRGAMRSRWERPTDGLKAPAAASKFAPLKAAESPPAFSLESDEDELFDQGLPFADHLPPLPDLEQAGDEFELPDAFAEDPDAFAEDDVQAEQDLAAYGGRGHSRRRIMGFVLVVAILLAGSAAFFAMRSSPPNVLPPIVFGGDAPNKTVPPAQSGTADLSKVNYDRAPDAPGTTLIAPPSKVANIPVPAPAKTGMDSLFDTTAGGAPVAEGSDTLVNEPRKVRTVTFDKNGAPINTDGPPATPAPLVAGPVTPAPTLAPPVTQAPIVRQIAPQTTPSAAPAQPLIAAPASRQTGNETQNVAGAGAGNGPNGDLLITATPGVPNPPSPSGGAAPGAVPQKPATIAVGPAPSDPSRTGAVPSTKPPQTPTPAPQVIAGPAPTPTPAAPPRVADPLPLTTPTSAAPGWMVQVSSQRNEDGARATYKDLQAHYPKILGSYPVTVQRADLGDKGVYFRARVGPFSQADAKRLCDDLKAAGGDCLVQPG